MVFFVEDVCESVVAAKVIDVVVGNSVVVARPVVDSMVVPKSSVVSVAALLIVIVSVFITTCSPVITKPDWSVVVIFSEFVWLSVEIPVTTARVEVTSSITIQL